MALRGTTHDSDWESNDSSSEEGELSDSDNELPRPKLPRPQLASTSSLSMPTKNTVWTNVLLEQGLSDSLSRTVTKVGASDDGTFIVRSVESYEAPSRQEIEARSARTAQQKAEMVKNKLDMQLEDYVQGNVDIERADDTSNSGASGSWGEKKQRPPTPVDDAGPSDDPFGEGTADLDDVEKMMVVPPRAQKRKFEPGVSRGRGHHRGRRDGRGSRGRGGRRFGGRGGSAAIPSIVDGVNLDPTVQPELLVDQLANVLRETKPELLARVVDVIGNEKAIHFYRRTCEVEKNGGMLVLNQSRRRTPGGVYLYLVRNDPSVTADMIKNIFQEEKGRERKIAVAKRKVQRGNTFEESLEGTKQLLELERQRRNRAVEIGLNVPGGDIRHKLDAKQADQQNAASNVDADQKTTNEVDDDDAMEDEEEEEAVIAEVNRQIALDDV